MPLEGNLNYKSRNYKKYFTHNLHQNICRLLDNLEVQQDPSQ